MKLTCRHSLNMFQRLLSKSCCLKELIQYFWCLLLRQPILKGKRNYAYSLLNWIKVWARTNRNKVVSAWCQWQQLKRTLSKGNVTKIDNKSKFRAQCSKSLRMVSQIEADSREHWKAYVSGTTNRMGTRQLLALPALAPIAIRNGKKDTSSPNIPHFFFLLALNAFSLI